MYQRVALIVYNDTSHEPEVARFTAPAVDVASLVALLRSPTVGNFDRVETAVNPPAGEILRWVDDFYRHKRRHDELLLYFIGHSLLDESGELYLAALDTRLDEVAETALPAAWLTDCMDRSYSRRQLLVLDCTCTLLPASEDGSELDIHARPSTAFRGKGSGRAVLSSIEINRHYLAEKNSVDPVAAGGLTRQIMQGLQTGTADKNNNGQIELKELYEYLQRQESQLHLSLWTYGSPGQFIIARNPQHFIPTQALKWDLISGAILAPVAIIVIGGSSDLRASIGLAGLFLLLYSLLYLAPD